MLFTKCVKETITLPSNIDMLDERTIHIALGVDATYMPYAGTAIISVLYNNRNNSICFHVFRDNFTENDNIMFNKILEVYSNVAVKIYIVNKEILNGLPEGYYWNHSIYYRAFAPLVLNGIASRVLYLDADTLCRKDLLELWNLDISEHIAAVVEDGLNRRERQKWFSHYSIVKSTSTPVYFNSGVLLINVEKYIKENIFEKFIELLNRYGQSFRYYDQDALNILLNNKVLYIDYRYNCQLYAIHNSESAVIIHYCGFDKPWNIDFDLPSFKEWIWYFKLSPWNDIAILKMRPKAPYMYRLEAVNYFYSNRYKKCFMSLIRGFCLKYLKLRF